MIEHYGDLAALGTIADVMPLTHDNRTLVRHGLELLADSARPGIRALVELAGLSGRPMTAVSGRLWAGAPDQRCRTDGRCL